MGLSRPIKRCMKLTYLCVSAHAWPRQPPFAGPGVRGGGPGRPPHGCKKQGMFGMCHSLGLDELMFLNLDDYASAPERLWCVSG